MIKLTKVLGIINIILSLILCIALMAYFYLIRDQANGYATIALFLISGFAVGLTLLMSIPFVILIIQFTWKRIQFYAITHTILVFISLAMLIISNTIFEL